MEYDLFDRMIKIIDVKGNYTTYSYDKMGNVIQKQVFNKENTLLSKIKNILILSQISLSSKKTINTIQTLVYTYNDKNQLIETIDPKGNKTTYTYDELGRNKEIIDVKGNKQVFNYDKLWNVLEKVSYSKQW